MKYVCDVCGWIYDEEEGSPDNGIEPGTKWEELPDDFVCPVCMVGKDQFSKEVQTKQNSERMICELYRKKDKKQEDFVKNYLRNYKKII